jgi:predicted RNA methylase
MLNYELDFATPPATGFDSVIERIERRNAYWSSQTSCAKKKTLGQVFTPTMLAKQLVGLIPDTVIPTHEKVIGDPGAGLGILSSCLAAHCYQQAPSPIEVLGFEIDERLKEDYQSAWAFFREQAKHPVNGRWLGDFTSNVEQLMTTGEWAGGEEKPKFVISNPPYQKLSSKSELAMTLSQFNVKVPNQYAAFVVLASQWLQEDGHLLVVLPRSFCSGQYFRSFRQWLIQNMSLEHAVLYRDRSCFKNVLQETGLFYFKKASQSSRVRVTVAEDPDSKPEFDLILPSSEILSEESWCFPRCAQDVELIVRNRRRERTLASMGLTLSTGKLELNRLHGEFETTAIYSKDFSKEGEWTWAEHAKPRTVPVSKRQLLSLPEEGGYVVLKRITANQGVAPQRLLPAFLSRETVKQDVVTVDNHVQVLHRDWKALSKEEGTKLIEFMRSEEAQAVIRAVSGTTQVNVGDLNQLRFPKP